jgi:hypothetical protein
LAIADSESAHDANALALTPTTSIKQAANLTPIEVAVDFIVFLLRKKSAAIWLPAKQTLIVLSGSSGSRGTYRSEAAIPQCKPGHLSYIFGTPCKLLMSEVLSLRQCAS